MSNNFQSVDFEGLTFPNYMYVEYVRVYQRTDFGSIGCDPAGELIVGGADGATVV
jgi:beta-glucan synthesis-associated protein KRE6